MATVKLNADGEVILKQGNVSCTCCGGEIICPEITTNYTVISKEMYDALLNGGNYVVNGTLTELSCSLNETKSGVTGGCIQQFFISKKTCDGPDGFIPNMQYASLSIGISIAQVVGEYRLTYRGGGQCPSLTGQPEYCYSFMYYIAWDADNDPPGYLVNVGSATINTTAGMLGPYGIWSIVPVGSGSLDVTITPF